MLPYAHQSISDEDVAAVAAALRSDWLTTGPRVPAFEEVLAAVDRRPPRDRVQLGHGGAPRRGGRRPASGRGDEAVTTPMTFAATANCVLYAGAEPRFADIDPGTLLIEPERVAAAITARTKALLPVDYAGPAGRLRRAPGDRRRGARRTA